MRTTTAVRTTAALAGCAALAVLGTTLATPPAGADTEVTPQAVTGTPITEHPVPRTLNLTGIPGVSAFVTHDRPLMGSPDPGRIEHKHVSVPVRYSVTPPVGGPHNARWMNAGVYTKPVPSERAVHDLEHGAVWITYDPTLPAAQRAALQTFVHRQSLLSEADGTRSNRFMILSPWSSSTLGAPIVISSWGFQLGVDDPSDPRLQQFVHEFRRTAYSPERDAPVDGVPVDVGGRPAADGSVTSTG